MNVPNPGESVVVFKPAARIVAVAEVLARLTGSSREVRVIDEHGEQHELGSYLCAGCEATAHVNGAWRTCVVQRVNEDGSVVIYRHDNSGQYIVPVSWVRPCQ